MEVPGRLIEGKLLKTLAPRGMGVARMNKGIINGVQTMCRPKKCSHGVILQTEGAARSKNQKFVLVRAVLTDKGSLDLRNFNESLATECGICCWFGQRGR